MVNIPLQAELRSGGCQCGAIRYRIVGPLGKAGICHCRMCQKCTGSFGAALVSVPAARISWTRGTPVPYRSSAIVTRAFCGACGTPVFMREDGDPNFEIPIGTLDRPDDIPPMTEQSGVESRLSWFAPMRDLPEQKTSDYRTADDLERLKSLQHPDHDTDRWP